jgi:hypothetical protein
MAASSARLPPDDEPYRAAEPPGRVDHRVKVLELALDGVRGRITALPATASVVVEDAQPGRGQQLGQPHRARIERPMLARTADQDHGRSRSVAIVGDRGAVVRSCS